MSLKVPFPHIVSSFPDVLLALTFLVTWIEPDTLGEGMVASLFQVMLLEFIIIHSAGFMAGIIYGNLPKAGKIKLFTGLSLFYFVFAAAFSLAFGFLYFSLAGAAEPTCHKLIHSESKPQLIE